MSSSDPRSDPLAEAIRLDDDGRIAEDMTCRSCGYALRGLAVDERCPECSALVRTAVHGDQLAFCDSRWVGQLAFGARWLGCSSILSIVGIYAIIGCQIVFWVMQPTTGFTQVALTMAYAIISLATIVGVMYVTQPDPGAAGHEPLFTVRRITRWGIVAELITTPIDAFLQTAGAGGTNVAFDLLVILLVVAYLSLVIISTVSNATLLVLLRRLAVRVPDAAIARQIRMILFGYVPSLVLMTLPILVYVAINSAAPGGVSVAGQVVISLSSLLGIVSFSIFTVWLVFVLFRFHRVLSSVRAATPEFAVDVEHR